MAAVGFVDAGFVIAFGVRMATRGLVGRGPSLGGATPCLDGRALPGKWHGIAGVLAQAGPHRRTSCPVAPPERALVSGLVLRADRARAASRRAYVQKPLFEWWALVDSNH